MTRRLLEACIGATSVVVVLVLAAMEFAWSLPTVWMLLPASPILGLLAMSAAGAAARRGSGTILAGVLALLASLALPLWVWMAAFFFWGRDIDVDCAVAISDAGYRSTPDAEIVRNYVPPGLFCYPEGLSGPVILASDLGLLIGFSVALVLITACLAAAYILARRDRMWSVRWAADGTNERL